MFICFLVCKLSLDFEVSFVMFGRSQWIICWPLFEEGTTRRVVNILQLMFKNRVQHQRFLCWSGFSGVFFSPFDESTVFLLANIWDLTWRMRKTIFKDFFSWILTFLSCSLHCLTASTVWLLCKDQSFSLFDSFNCFSVM